MIAPPHTAAATTTAIHACSLVVAVHFEQHVLYEFMQAVLMSNNINYNTNIAMACHDISCTLQELVLYARFCSLIEFNIEQQHPDPLMCYRVQGLNHIFVAPLQPPPQS